MISRFTHGVKGGKFSVMERPRYIRAASGQLGAVNIVPVLAFWRWHDGQTFVALGICRSHCKDHVVFRELHGCARHIADVFSVFPRWAGCSAPENLVGSHCGRTLPGQRGIIGEFFGHQFDIRWRRRGRGQ